ncbi:MAG: ribonuclease E/G, partial [Actinomycetes bacterium]
MTEHDDTTTSPGGDGTEGPVASPPPSPAPKVGDTRPAPQIGDTRPSGPSGPGAPGHEAPKPAASKRVEGRAPKPVTAASSSVQSTDDEADDVGEGAKGRDREGGGSGRRKRRRGGRERKGRTVGRYLMCVHVEGSTTHIAMLEGRSLVEHYVVKDTDETTQIDGNIYLGRVQNVLPGMEAAFVDIGIPKNAVLYRGDIHFDAEDIEGGRAQGARIEDVLKAGQLITCQVTKNPIGAKGARLTQEVSIPGRFAVLVPNSSTIGISKRLGDNERKRLRKILDEIRP